MRKKLRELKEQRMTFTGTFERHGTKIGWKGREQDTVLLVNIKDNDGNKVADHLWFNFTKGFRKLGLLEGGEVIEFCARVKRYDKGYVNRRRGISERKTDYKLSYPTKFRIIGYED